jgi:peptide/nickel transport system permease protein
MNWLPSVDEFGRNVVVAAGLSACNSLMKAGLVVGILCILSVLLVFTTEIKLRSRISVPIDAALDSLDSVPAFLWALAAISVMPNGGNMLVGAIFIVASLPIAFNAVRGSFYEVLAQPYCEAARALGTSDYRLLRLHILPNAIPLLLPMFIHLLGAALAVYGAVGIFGMVSRRDLDLGVLIMRGKEQAAFDASMLVYGLFMYIVLFVIIYGTIAVVTARNSKNRQNSIKNNKRIFPRDFRD